MDVFATRGAEGAGEAVGVEIVLKGAYLVGAAGAVGGEGRGMEADEVDTAAEATKEAQQFVGMAQGVVDAVEHGVFKRDAPLPFPVVLFEHGNDIGNGVGAFGRHEAQTLVVERVVEADSHMAAALFDELPGVG